MKGWNRPTTTVLISVFPSDWGWIGTAVSPAGLAGIVLPQPTEDAAWTKLRSAWPEDLRREGDPPGDLRKRLLDYLAGMPVDFSDLPLDLPNAPSFRLRVWEACARIQYGETRSYRDMAREVGSPGAFRAVGGAMAANPIPIVIPCHRVVGSSGGLVGFGGGLDQKMRMLDMESRTRTRETQAG